MSLDPGKTLVLPPRDRGRARAHRPRVAPRIVRLGVALAIAAVAGAFDAGARPADSPAAATPARRDGASSLRPSDLTDVSAWLRYKAATQRPALPLESLVFYRRGLAAWRSGSRDEALNLVRDASELDPAAVDPHLTMISWTLFRDPGRALHACAAVVEIARESFLLQLSVAANALYLAVQALFLGLLAAGLIIVALRNTEIRHGWQERLARALAPRAARWWPWVFLLVPYLVGLGLALPTVFFLAFLWPVLKRPERALFVLLAGTVVAAPLVVAQTARLATPMSEDRGPFFGVLGPQGESFAGTGPGRLAGLAAEHPDHPFIQFGRAWAARQADDLAVAESAYRSALGRWPENDRVLNNLGNVLSLQGRHDEAIELYRRAVGANSTNAVAYFNLSQAYTQRFDYHAANEALSHASALNFDLHRARQAQAAGDGVLPLVDQWIAPRDYWRALLSEPTPAPLSLSPPPAWHHRVETSGWPFSAATVAFVLLGLLMGVRQHRAVPLRRCSNCERIVCRRCAERRRELALCRDCAAVEARARAPEFVRMLLVEQRRNVRRAERIAVATLAALIPGLGLIAFRRVFVPLALLVAAAAMASAALSAGAPFAYQPRVQLPDRQLPLLAALVPWAVVYAISIWGYLAAYARHEARVAAAVRPARPRVSPAARVTSAAA